MAETCGLCKGAGYQILLGVAMTPSIPCVCEQDKLNAEHADAVAKLVAENAEKGAEIEKLKAKLVEKFADCVRLEAGVIQINAEKDEKIAGLNSEMQETVSRSIKTAERNLEIKAKNTKLREMLLAATDAMEGCESYHPAEQYMPSQLTGECRALLAETEPT